ncbi:LuxR C-terminal-related transcriptional regulator [uncultured Polaribacter sp.]|uniref:LuxR C-terminal-related transcriptional regulator n=1 Tax=uncultured Polaribacter sp. TaxID=174711 RepID=UPI002601C025|nr:LuxR C-terminal-related transcriptional regulator [uncultured Polaribacter sp.]
MKFKFFIVITFLFQFSVFSQTEIYFFKDSNHSFTIDNIEKANFQLLEKEISDKYFDNYYWFKIPAIETNSKYIFRITQAKINSAEAYYNKILIKKLNNERYLSYSFFRDHDTYIKINPSQEGYIPVELNVEEESILKEKNQLLINGFYYGFTLLVILYNLFYYVLFKDNAFLYYALFLVNISFGIFNMDGMLNFYNISPKISNILLIANYIFLAYFSSKFAKSYLFLNQYFPKFKKYSYVIEFAVVVLGVLYLFQGEYLYLLLLNILIFTLFFTYWLFAVFMFKKNVYIKMIVFAYVIILFSGIDFYVLKYWGVSIMNVNATTIKIGAFFEMIILSIAVLYRMNTLKHENNFMRSEIVNFSKQVNEHSVNTKEKNKPSLYDLSHREREIFDLLVLGKSNKEIADELNISINTVKFHVKNIYEKLNIKSRKEVLNLT